jgi:hypothetical protein
LCGCRANLFFFLLTLITVKTILIHNHNLIIIYKILKTITTAPKFPFGNPWNFYVYLYKNTILLCLVHALKKYTYYSVEHLGGHTCILKVATYKHQVRKLFWPYKTKKNCLFYQPPILYGTRRYSHFNSKIPLYWQKLGQKYKWARPSANGQVWTIQTSLVFQHSL